MSMVPVEIGEDAMLWFTPIDDRHRPTGNCRHFTPSGVVGVATGLFICGRDKGPVILHRCDADWVSLADTWHETVAEAKRQAEFEYAGSQVTWQRPKVQA